MQALFADLYNLFPMHYCILTRKCKNVLLHSDDNLSITGYVAGQSHLGEIKFEFTLISNT